MDGRQQHDHVLGLIYDSALDGSRWNDAVTALANAMGCVQGTLEIHDPYAGWSRRMAPLCDPVFQKSYVEYYGKLFTLSGKTKAYRVGEIFDSAGLGLTSEAFRATEFYNEWWLPQGTGGATLMANVAQDGRATASVTLYRHRAGTDFEDRQRAEFSGYVRHLMRAVEIHRRLHLAESVSRARGSLQTGFGVIDPDGRLLTADEQTRTRLAAAGLLRCNGMDERLCSPDGGLERLISGAVAAPGKSPGRAGEYTVASAEGAHIVVTVTPCSEQTGADWFAIDRPAALVSVSDERDKLRSRIDRLVQVLGLTRAEAAVAIEISRGDGRAAAASRLGIRPATVRSHLTAIFDKLVHRQAQLARLVADV